MTVPHTERQRGRNSRRDDARPPRPAPLQDQKQPPSPDLTAERGALGAMLLSAEAIPVVTAWIEPGDYYDTRHGEIHRTICELVAANKPADPITVAARLAETGTLARLGGAPYLHTLISGVPVAANAGYYAEIVADAAEARRYEELGTRLQVASRATDPALRRKVATEVREQLSATARRDGNPLPLMSIRELRKQVADTPQTYLLEPVWPGDAYGVIAAEDKAGKAQPLDAPVLTPAGWTTIGALSPGDVITGADGRPQVVVAVHERGQRQVWAVKLNDGTEVECCGEHLWAVCDHNDRHRDRPWRVLETEHIAKTLRTPAGKYRHTLPLVAPVEYRRNTALPLDPYLLGLLLGNGCLTREPMLASDDEEIHRVAAKMAPAGVCAVRRNAATTAFVRTAPSGPNSLTETLRGLGLMGHKADRKFIPAVYLTASVADRLALLNGLMDTDGGMERRRATFCTTSRELAANVQQLVQSLGGTAKAAWRVTRYNGKPGLPSCRITVRLPVVMNPFRLSRKADAYARCADRRDPIRVIVGVEQRGWKPMRCITVSNPDALYVTTGHTLTHNSWAVIDMALAVAVGGVWMGQFHCLDRGPVILFAGEGGTRNLLRRIDAVAEFYGIDTEDVDLEVCTRVPHLTDAGHLALVSRYLERPRRLVIVDPLYLAARGANGSDLYAMGEHLEGIQHVCQQAGAALSVVTHFNKTGTEKNGKSRITGVGPAAWGRVIATAAVESRESTGSRTSVVLNWDFVGGEIPDTELFVRRRVWADDPSDLNSPMHYEIERVDPEEMKVRDGAAPAHARVLAIVRSAAGPLTVTDIGDRLADDGHPLKPRTIQDALQKIDEHLDSRQIDGRGTREFWIKGRI